MDQRLEVNRANWDERTQIHLDSRFYDVEGWLGDSQGPRSRELAALGDVTGLRLLHLQCHFGKDTLSFARVGAQVTGLDFSPAAIAAARDLALRAGLVDQSEFVCAEVYEAAESLGYATFDIVYVSLGSLCWLPSVARWAEQVGALVAPGGRFYIHDTHPLTDALADDRPVIEHDYFEEPDPYVDDSEDSYTDSDRPLLNRRNYSWNHGIGETVTALIRHGLRLEWLVEHDWYVEPRYPWLVQTEEKQWTSPPEMPRVPLSFSLLASRGLNGEGRPR
jgi:SAM-dependent methyltransferase